MFPGMILDTFTLRREYDMAMHQLVDKNKKGGEW